MTVPQKIALLLSDIDGTLVGDDKQLTPATVAAVRALHEAGIGFTVTSSRPPRGLKAIVEALDIRQPLGAFNGAMLVTPALDVLEARYLPADAARSAVDLLAQRGIDAWLFTQLDWFLINPGGPRIDLERRTVGFEPKVVSSWPDEAFHHIGKIVGVSDDFEKLAACEAEMRRVLGHEVAAARSQAYYLDITHPEANKGAVVAMLSRTLGIPIAAIAAIGDGGNDVTMLEQAGLGIAMGNGVEALKRIATVETDTANNDGFAQAVHKFILPQG